MKALGVVSQMNPLKDIYDIVFQMTICEELATDLRMIQNMSDLYWKLEKSATPAPLLLPWVSGTARNNKEEATKGLYTCVVSLYGLEMEGGGAKLRCNRFVISDGADNLAITLIGAISLLL
jgi:sterol 14-demethylase